MNLIRRMAIVGAIGLAGLISGCASEPIKSPVKQVPVVISPKTKLAIKKLDSYKQGTILRFPDSYWIKDKEDDWVRYKNNCESDDGPDGIPSEGMKIPDMLLNTYRSAKVYLKGLPKRDPCYKDPNEEVLEEER